MHSFAVCNILLDVVSLLVLWMKLVDRVMINKLLIIPVSYMYY